MENELDEQTVNGIIRRLFRLDCQKDSERTKPPRGLFYAIMQCSYSCKEKIKI